MHKHNILTITLIISGLALNPVMGENTDHRKITYSKVNHTFIIAGIADVLQSRGVEGKAAESLAKALVDEKDGMLLMAIAYSLEHHGIVTKEEVMTYLSQAALHKRKLDFNSYDQLIGMVEKIKQKPIDEHTRKKLRELAEVNQKLFV
ncbi:hypothetical protein [Sulfurovum mangrovi]|uniref:hypothetical protein n=1 Tax=Sulfurovum mangrovi TaxID=2893889 RepID=UPI001E506C0C|nr:hypothetical protein [Sulfurovum mangrovi]UFH58083.1 hypothetical protein LN246_06935 [Sulfurovum mangrovi]